MVFGSRVAPFLVLHFYSLLTLHNPATAAVTLVTLGRTSQMLFVLLYFLCAARPVLYSIPSRSPTSHCCWTASSSFRSANFRSITDNRCDHSTKHLIRFITKLNERVYDNHEPTSTLKLSLVGNCFTTILGNLNDQALSSQIVFRVFYLSINLKINELSEKLFQYFCHILMVC